MLRQHTLRKPVHVIGIGVHTGVSVRMTLRPAPIDAGVRFVRMDLHEAPGVNADARLVTDTLLATTLASGAARIMTVEHLMAALWGAGVDNVQVEVWGGEVPILDGSAAPFIDLIRQAGLVSQDAPRVFLRVKETVTVLGDGDSAASLSPCSGFRAAYTFVSSNPLFAQFPKRIAVDFRRHAFADAIGRARSFGLAGELDQARALNRCLGSSLDNSVGLAECGVLNVEGLRYPDELVKHKVLDAIGDLYLAGRPMLGAFEGYKSGHALNNLLVRALLDNGDAWELTTQPDITPEGRATQRRGLPRPVVQAR